MTLDGTNTWVVRAAAGARSVVVDPGPLDDAHLAAVAEAAGDVAVVLLSHGHADHSAGARAFAERAGCGVRAVDPAYQWLATGLRDGDTVTMDGLDLHVLVTPGHTADSVCFVLPSQSAVLSGDTVLGRGTSVVAHPDGELGAYLRSLRTLRDLARSGRFQRILPGHGPEIRDALPVLEAYLDHRAERLQQVRAALTAGAGTAAEVVERVYADVDPALRHAAELSVAAQLAYLRSR